MIKKLVSGCCGADYIIRSNEASHISGAYCIKCGKPCFVKVAQDIHTKKKIVNDEVKKVLMTNFSFSASNEFIDAFVEKIIKTVKENE